MKNLLSIVATFLKKAFRFEGRGWPISCDALQIDCLTTGLWHDWHDNLLVTFHKFFERKFDFN